MKKGFLSITLFASLCLPSIGSEATPWPLALRNEFIQEIDEVGEDFRASLFESLTDIEATLFEYNQLELGIRVRRQVFDNQDVLGTWTVADTFQVPVTLPLSLIDPVSVMSSGTLSLNLGLKLGLNAVHLRQVYPREIENLPSLQELNNHANDLDEFNLGDQDIAADAVFVDGDEFEQSELDDLLGLISFDRKNPRAHARYSNLFNLLTHPLGLPLTVGAVARMKTGDIRSYSLDGLAQFGPSIGWAQVELPLLGQTGASAGVTTYLRNEWRISVHKEKENQALLKVSTSSSKGVQTHLGSRSQDHVLFDGFVVLGSTVGRVKAPVVPFHFQALRDYTKAFEIGYRYDLTNQQARRAYGQAALGRLALSDQLALEENSGVERIFTKDQVEQAQRGQYQMALSFFFQKGSSQGLRDMVAQIELDGREFHLFRSIAESSESSDNLWGSSEYEGLRFIVESDPEIYQQGSGGLNLTLEGRIENQKTTLKEYAEQAERVERLTGLKDFFPRAPRFTPEQAVLDSCINPTPQDFRDQRRRRMSCPVTSYDDLGSSSYFYRISYTREQIERFLEMDEEHLWQTLELAFGLKEGTWQSRGDRMLYGLLGVGANLANIPLFFFDESLERGHALFVAQNFLDDFKKLKEVDRSNPREFVERLARLFSSRRASYALANVLRLALVEEKVALTVQARAQTFFGQLNFTEGQFDPLDRITTRADQVIGFDQARAQQFFDSSAVVSQLKVNRLNDQEIAVEFELSHTPRFLYVNIARTPSWGRYQNLVKAIVFNRGEFKAGLNRLTLQRDGEQGLRRDLARALFSGEQLTLRVGLSRDAQSWGGLSTLKFRFLTE